MSNITHSDRPFPVLPRTTEQLLNLPAIDFEAVGATAREAAKGLHRDIEMMGATARQASKGLQRDFGRIGMMAQQVQDALRRDFQAASRARLSVMREIESVSRHRARRRAPDMPEWMFSEIAHGSF